MGNSWLIYRAPAGCDVQNKVFRLRAHKIVARALVSRHHILWSYNVTTSRTTSKELTMQPSPLKTRFLRNRVLNTPLPAKRKLLHDECVEAYKSHIVDDDDSGSE